LGKENLLKKEILLGKENLLEGIRRPEIPEIPERPERPERKYIKIGC